MRKLLSFANRHPHLSFLVFAGFTVGLIASSGGKTGRTSLSGTPGCTCHGSSPSAEVTVSIAGPETLEVNETASYQVTISGGPLSAAGTNIASDGGTLATVDASLQLSGNELTHSSPKAPSSGSVTFDFDLTAPANEATLTLAANGNSVNLNGSSSGDQWNFAEDLLVSVVNTSSIFSEGVNAPKQFALGQNYPNPFNPSTTISYSLDQAGEVTLDVYDSAGKRITRLVEDYISAGQHQVMFDGSNLASGSYFYRLQANGKNITKRMFLIK